MSFEIARDNRSVEQTKKDYNYGKHNESLVIQNLPNKAYAIDSGDEFGETRAYVPDAFITINGQWFPCEIKFTDKYLKHIELKDNQCKELMKMNGLFIQATTEGYWIFSAKHMFDKGKFILGSDSYCNKDSYRITPEKGSFKKWNKEINFIKKLTGHRPPHSKKWLKFPLF